MAESLRIAVAQDKRAMGTLMSSPSGHKLGPDQLQLAYLEEGDVERAETPEHSRNISDVSRSINRCKLWPTVCVHLTNHTHISLLNISFMLVKNLVESLPEDWRL